MKVVSFFSGCGGLDLGFEQAGFDIVWANEFDVKIQSTYAFNHPNTFLCKSDIRTIKSIDIPSCDGFIGGPPCQAWSEAGLGLGLKDVRGQVFLDYIRIINEKQPKFFLIENVKGLVSDKHKNVFFNFLVKLQDAGFKVYFKILDAVNFSVPQNRERVFIVGIRNDIHIDYSFPECNFGEYVSLKEAIGDINEPPIKYRESDIVLFEKEKFRRYLNNDVFDGCYSARYMSRNRVRGWDEPSFTIPATAVNVPLHPQAPKMDYISGNLRSFSRGNEYLYRRLSVRECARIQTFPDSFQFLYSNILDGYRMVGNAVPPRMGRSLALSLKKCFDKVSNVFVLIGYCKSNEQLLQIRKNYLYYIRRGTRSGAIRDVANFPVIDYLILHDENNIFMFSLNKIPPTACNSCFLKSKGFVPSGDNYWLFNLDAELKFEDFNLKKYIEVIKMTKRPHIEQMEII